MVPQQFRVVIIRRSSSNSSRSSGSGGANLLHFNDNHHRRSRNNSSIRIDKSKQQLGHQQHCSFSSSSNGSSSLEQQQQQQQRPRMAWLDLRGTFLSALERLVIDELLLRHDPITDRCWGIVGVHEPTTNRILQISSSSSLSQSPQIIPQSVKKKNDSDESDPTTINNNELKDDVYGHDKQTHHNDTCCIILGIGGKAERLINIPAAKKDGILTLRRFTGGGTVVVDHTSLLTTLIIKDDAHIRPAIKPYPREIMEWTNEYIFGPAFTSWNNEIVAATAAIANSNNNREKQTLIFHGKSCGLSGGDGGQSQQQQTLLTTSTPSIIMPTFRLRENDYVLNDRKVGGNAQSIVSGGFLHHTSFLWDWDDTNMDYLTLPSKRPEYRGDRNHDEFLVRLKETYGKGSTKHSLFLHMKNALSTSFQLEEVTLQDVLEIANIKFGGLQQWFDGKCRTKIVEL
jgi:lipoate-protein ligase A